MLTQAILNVMTIVAIISFTAFFIIFLVDLFLSIKNKNGSIFFRNKQVDSNDRPEVAPAQEQQAQPAEEQVIRPKVLTKEEQTWDEEAARREQNAIESANSTVDEEALLREAKQKDLENMHIKDQQRQQIVDDFDDFDDLFATPKQDAEPEQNFDAMIEEINKECVTKYEATKKVEIVEPVKEVLEPVATKEDEDFGIKIEDNDLNDFDALFESESKEEKVEEVAPVVATKAEIVNAYEFFPQDALQARLEKLQERLKFNEKELKANRKEYNPLARVNRSLKRDQEKLRRREAIVARKKVMLYGVNNYVDIDEEKAKKLSEDLDLLDGLRLSVQHCEEVMEQNKDRFPILERTNLILTEQNKHLKEDIAEVKAAIEKLNQDNAE